MPLPDTHDAFTKLSPAEIQTLAEELVTRPLNKDTINDWLRDWAHIGALFQESLARLDVATAVNTADEHGKQALDDYRKTILPIDMKLSTLLNEKLLAHENILPAELAIPLQRQKRYRQLNSSDSAIALLNQEATLLNDYETIRGAQSIHWQGQDITLRQARQFYEDDNRDIREQVWRLVRARELQDSNPIHDIWVNLLDIRQKLAQANGLETYTDYRWREFGRDDYTPQDSLHLQQIMLDEWTPVVAHIYHQQQQQLRLDSLRPWDTSVNPTGKSTLKPYSDAQDFIQRTSRLFHRMHPAFGADFDRMVNEGFIDLADRENTGSMGGFSRAIGRGGVFMFMNLQGSRVDAEIIVHEMGHAFALIESCKLPYMMQWAFPTDFSETPSGVMEMLSMPYWDEYYIQDQLTQAYSEYILDTLRSSLEDTITDVFYHWVYANLEEAKDAEKCADKWLELHQRYFPAVDYTSLEAQFGNQWQSMMLNFHYPFFAMEYVYGRVVGLNLLGLVLEKPEHAIEKYRHALSLGSSVSTKDLFNALDTHFPLSREGVVSALRVAQTYL